MNTYSNPDLVMIIDDGLLDALLTKSILGNNFARETIIYSDPVEAYNYIEKASKANALNYIPDLIFLDIEMPQLNGFALLDKLNLLPGFVRKDTKIIMNTSSEDQENILKASTYKNIINYFIKPLNKMNLISLNNYGGLDLRQMNPFNQTSDEKVVKAS